MPDCNSTAAKETAPLRPGVQPDIQPEVQPDVELGGRRCLKARVFAIDRLRMGTDGRGITALVGFMGCPLNCAYCLNDRCHDAPHGNDGPALRPGIRTLTPKRLYGILKKDNIYFRATGGGVCFGGGEPVMHADFIAEFRRQCGSAWKITVETSLHGCLFTTMKQLAPVVDHWIVDVKDMNPGIYRQYTGQESDIARNLSFFRTLGLMDRVTVKVPLIPGYNTACDVQDSIRKLKELGFARIESLQYVKRVSKYSKSKY